MVQPKNRVRSVKDVFDPDKLSYVDYYRDGFADAGFPAVRMLRENLPTAKRFIFDAPASTFIRDIYERVPVEIMKQSEFAVAPYPTMYMQFDESVSFGPIRKHLMEALKLPSLTRAGLCFFIHNGMVITTIVGTSPPDDVHSLTLPYVFFMGKPQHPTKVMFPIPMYWDNLKLRGIDPAEAMDDPSLIEAVDNQGRAQFFFGDVAKQTEYSEMAFRLAQSNDIGWFDSNIDGREDDIFRCRHEMASIGRLAGTAKGALLIVWTAYLLLLRGRGVTQVTKNPGFSKTYGRHRRAFAATSTVKIDFSAGPLRTRRTVIRAIGSTRRRHDVISHYVHWFGKKVGCDHDYVEQHDGRKSTLGHDLRRWKCSQCGRIRTLRLAYYKGDATKGFVTKDYTVTA
jgi:hypothetical protein